MDASLSNVQRATAALQWFHQEMATFPGNYSLSFDGLIAYFNSWMPGFLENYGKALSAAQTPSDIGISDATIKAGLIRLADQAQGTLPSGPSGEMPFFFVLQDEYGKWNLDNWVRIGEATAVATAKDVAAVTAFGGTAFIIGAGIVFALSLRK